jgi:hypothetical protein
MGIFRPRSFCVPETIKSVAPGRLLAFLEPHRTYLVAKGIELPRDADDLDYDRLVLVLMEPDGKMPRRLVDALYLVDEMSSLSGMDALLEAARERGIDLGEDDALSAADVAVHLWLLAPDLLERKHAERFVYRRRSFEHYQTNRFPLPGVGLPSAADLQVAEQALDDWFAQHNRGRATRLFTCAREDALWFLVRHGEPFRREESLEDGQATSVFYRPLRYDVVVYHPGIGELRINARSPREKKFYQRQFGRLLFGDENFFPGASKYTLEPLRFDGEMSVVCSDVDGMESVTLREVQWSWGGTNHEAESFRADDVFAVRRMSDWQVPQTAWISRAVFQIKFADSRVPRSVTIRPSNIALYTRDSDAALVEEWLEKRGFLRPEGNKNHEAVRAMVVGS